ncbi:MAG: DUF3093 domain-containing protein [Actinomycetes bacterium]
MSESDIDAAVTTIRYRERLVAPVTVWLITAAMTASLGVAYGHWLGNRPGVVAFVISEGIVAFLLVTRTPIVQVDDHAFRAGKARLPLEFVGRIVPLDRDETVTAKGAAADPRAYLCSRGWIPGAILVEVTDEDDPHPYWLVSTRRGHELALVLATQRDAVAYTVTARESSTTAITALESERKTGQG